MLQQEENHYYHLRRRAAQPSVSGEAGTRGLAAASGVFSFANNDSSQLAGTFFRASLWPYLAFLYFLAGSRTRIPPVANFGFQYVLLFVVMTIVGGILAQSKYQVSLADSDWLHGTSESLLTVSNIIIVYGLQDCIVVMDRHNNNSQHASSVLPPRRFAVTSALALLWSAMCLLCVCLGTAKLGWGVHSQLLGGFGNLNVTMPWAKHPEPVNALSIPTWIVHWSSVYEYVFAMYLVWQFADTTRNPTWKGLTLGMIPLHASSICAVTHHFFYNAPELQFLVSLQAFLTLMGNCTTMIAAFRIATTVGWTWESMMMQVCCCEFSPPNVGNDDSEQSADVIAETEEHLPQSAGTAHSSMWYLLFKLIVLVVTTSYLVKYGELGLDLPFEPNSGVALGIVVGIPCLTTLPYIYWSIMDHREVPTISEESHHLVNGANSSNGYRTQSYSS